MLKIHFLLQGVNIFIFLGLFRMLIINQRFVKILVDGVECCYYSQGIVLVVRTFPVTKLIIKFAMLNDLTKKKSWSFLYGFCYFVCELLCGC